LLLQAVDAKTVMAAMKQHVYNHCPAVAAVGQSLAAFVFVSHDDLSVVSLGPIEQLREYNRTRSRMYTISH
jgi:hypothetical protein